MTSPAAENFDRELGLDELLHGINPHALNNALRDLLGADARLLDARNEVHCRSAEGGAPASSSQCIAVSVELEPVAYLEADADPARLRAAAFLLQQMLRGAARYLMASRLHTEAVHADYEALQQKHAALQASEARYKTLAETLEQRVTEQVTTIEQAQQQLYQAEKMAAVGQLAAGVAHEINTPLGFAKSNLRSAEDYVARLVCYRARLENIAPEHPSRAAWTHDDLDFMLEDFAQLLRESGAGIARVARIVADLKDFSNVDGAEEQVADVNALVRTVCNVAAAQVAPRADVVLELNELPALRCRPGHLNQVFLNLLLNAAQAMQQRGAITVHTRHDSGAIIVDIADTGHGIAPDVLKRVFDPFFTTRDVGQGTGLGLTVSRDIVLAHGGRIDVRSAPGAGTTFTIRLPVEH